MKPHIIILQFFFLLLSVFCYSQGHYIGQNYGGGIIFFIDGSGEHGLIVAPNDQAKDRIWGFVGSSPGYKSVTGATSLDNGSLNTEKIIQTIPLPETSAAFICDTLTLGGFTDWYLPAIRELRQIYDKQDFIKSKSYVFSYNLIYFIFISYIYPYPIEVLKF